MKLVDKLERLEQAANEYHDMLSELSEVEHYANEAARAINEIMDGEKKRDQERLAKLQKALADSPRMEYAQITEKLDADDKPETPFEYQLRQYGHQVGRGRLYPDERKRLEKRKRELERTVLFLPPTPEETEAASLAGKEYKPSGDQKKGAEAFVMALEETHRITKEAREELRNALHELDEALKPIRQQLTHDGVELTERAYRSALEAVERIARWN